MYQWHLKTLNTVIYWSNWWKLKMAYTWILSEDFDIKLQEFKLGRNIVLTLQTLGVVFGDVGTSPLYTFDVMFNKYQIGGKEDVLGALCLVLYTLILIPLVKYILVVLWGNDDGEGMLEVEKWAPFLPLFCQKSWELGFNTVTTLLCSSFHQGGHLLCIHWYAEMQKPVFSQTSYPLMHGYQVSGCKFHQQS